ncbi:MAG TPA: FHA domain-containing protein [Planctomycetaceae bacterium]|nr:FHA domain-containing protein [Planctomycetaceae bacterium]
MSDELAQRLRAATGAAERFQITVMSEDSVAPVQHEFSYPFVVVGRGEGCDILLQNPRVSFRHAYLQVIEGRVFCVDLASRNGVFWPDGPRKFGWVTPNEPIQIGPYILRVFGDEARDRSLAESLADLNPLERYRGQAGSMPAVDLEFRYETSGQPTWAVNRLLTLIGRSPVCKLRFDTPKVSGVHCGLLLTRHALWAIDLRGRGGTRVDGEQIRAQPLESGNEVSFADFQIAVYYEEPPDMAAPDRLTDNAAEAETSLGDIESPFLRDPPVPETAVASPADKTGAGDWLGSIFKIEPVAKTLVVIPIADGGGFRYQQLHIEANNLQRKFETRAFDNLVMDLASLHYFGTELIGVMIRLARAVTNIGGRSAFCAPSPRMLEVLESMRLTKLWPIYPTRTEALQHVKG